MTCELNNTNLLDFLLFTYFGIESFDKIESSKVDEVCAKRAYQDLARTVAFSMSTSKLTEMQKQDQPTKESAEKYKNAKKELVDKVIRNIAAWISEDISSKSKSDFDDWHNVKCNEIIDMMCAEKCEETKIVSGFSYGQAQKWLNMSVKYKWLLTESEPSPHFHIPIDSYIIEKLYKTGFEQLPSKPWSKWNQDDYCQAFRARIPSYEKKEDVLLDLNWESKVWIEVAKERAIE